VDILTVNNFGDTRSGGLAGPMGLFIIVLMSIATVLLIRNMNKRLRRLPDSFPDVQPTQREAESDRPESDPARAAGDAARTGVEPVRPATAASRPEAEVTGDTTQGDSGSADGDERAV
jgi:hypothetical protein